eukprot:25150-Pyramimonas_sp.AAC.1
MQSFMKQTPHARGGAWGIRFTGRAEAPRRNSRMLGRSTQGALHTGRPRTHEALSKCLRTN